MMLGPSQRSEQIQVLDSLQLGPAVCSILDMDERKEKELLLPFRADPGERYRNNLLCKVLDRWVCTIKDIYGIDNVVLVHAGSDAEIITSGAHGCGNDFSSLYGKSYKASNSKSAKKWSLGQEYGPLDSAEKRRKQLPQDIFGIDNVTILAHAGRDAEIITSGAHGRGNNFSSLYGKSYKVVLGCTVDLSTLTNKRVGMLAAIDSRLTGGAPILLLDSGASLHVVGDKRCLTGYQPLANPRMGRQPDNSLVIMVGVGTIQTEHFSITNVFYVEGLGVNLISASQLDKNYGMCSWFGRGKCGVMLPDGTTAGEGTLEDGVYVLSKLHVPAGPVMEA